MSEPEMDQWATHLPALTAIVSATSGPILECGVGIWSTPILHAMCAPHERPLISIESKLDWYELFRPFHNGSWHKILYVSNWTDIGDAPPAGFIWPDVAFVDHGFAPRGPVVEILREISKIVVMHDSECDYCGYTEPLQKFDWVYTHTFSPAWTTLAGMGAPPPWLESALPIGTWGVPTPYR